MNYWIIVNGQQQGPFSVDELRGMSITPSTQVWAEGMPNWVSAGTVPELASVISSQFSTPPPSYSTPQSQPRYGSPSVPRKPDTYLVWAILSTILCCLPFGIVSIVYASKVDSYFTAGDYDGAENASRKAKNWAIWAAVSGLVFAILYIVFYVFVLAVAVDAGADLYDYEYGY